MKKALSLLLGSIMLIGILAACSSDPSSSSSSEANTDGGTSSAVENTNTDSGDRPTITWMMPYYTTMPWTLDGSDEVFERIQEYTGVNLDITYVADTTYDERFGVTLMGSDMPMMITSSGNINSVVVQAAQSGAFWDLNEFIWDSEAYPNLSQANPAVTQELEVNGELIGIYRARPVGRNGISYREDWAEALGLSAPTNMEELYEMCYQFTYGDPDGNGIDDTYGIALCEYIGPIEMIITFMGGGNGWAERDGELVPSHYTDEWKEAMDWLRKMYDEGLVYEDWAVRDSNTWSDDLRNGECGIFMDVLDNGRRIWDYFIENEIPSVVNPDEYASMALIGAIESPQGEKVIKAFSGYNGFYMITKAASEEDVRNCLQFLDRMCDNEMLVLVDYGIEGREDGHSIVDGYVVMNDPSMQAELRVHNGGNQFTAYIPNLASTDPTVELDERRQLEEAVKNDNVQYAVTNPALKYLINSESYTVNGGNLDEMLKNFQVQYICMQLDEAGLQAAIDNWNTQGGAQMVEEVNALYAADK